MRFLSLFAGIGGFDLGLERAGMECVGQVEIDPFCQKVLAKHWPDVKRMTDIRDVKGDEFGPVDLISGGYPCQPFSVAGKRGGEEDDRYLWPQAHRLVAAIRPVWCLFENVAGHIHLGLDRVLSDLEGEDYTVWPLLIPACAVAAPHRRERLWIMAHNARIFAERQEQRSKRQRVGASGKPLSVADDAGEQRSGSSTPEPREHQTAQEPPRGCGGSVALTESQRWQQGNKDGGGRGQGSGTEQRARPGGGCRWLPEPAVGRVAHGVPSRVDRLRSLGNAVVPQVVEMIGRAIMESEKAT